MPTDERIRQDQLELAPVTLKDLPAIAEHYAHEVQHGVATFDTTIPNTSYWEQKVLESENQAYPIWVARDLHADACVTGWAGVSRFDSKLAYGRCAEFSFYIVGPYQGRGVGRVLLNHALNELRKHPTIETLVSRITLQQEASLHLHRSVGFRHIGTLENVGFKLGAGLSVALYQYHLNKESLAST